MSDSRTFPIFPNEFTNHGKENIFGLYGEVIAPGTTSTYFGLTLQQYAAIQLKVPNSGFEWLDNMIKESILNDLTKSAMEALLAQEDSDGDFYEIADEARKMANITMHRWATIHGEEIQ